MTTPFTCLAHKWGIRTKFLSVAFVIVALTGHTQLVLEDIVCHGQKGDEVAKEAILTRDGGILMLGELESAANSLQVLVAKLDSELGLEWSVDLGGFEYDLSEDLFEDTDGAIMIGAYSTGGGFGRRDYYVLRLDPDGKVIREKFFGSPGDDALTLIRKGESGEIFMAGLSYGAERSSDVYIYRWDTAFNEIDRNRIFHTGSDAVWDIRPAGDNGWLMAGQTTGTANGEKDFFLLRTDALGKQDWYMHYGGSGDDRAYAIDRLNDQWILGGFSTSRSAGIRNGWIISVDDNGTMNWELDIPNFQTLEIHDLVVYNERILATGFAFNPQTGNDLFLAEISKEGELVELHMLETPLDQKGRSVLIKDGKIHVFGENAGLTDNDLCIYIYDWAPLSTNDEENEALLGLVPNPASDKCQILSSSSEIRWEIIDLSGNRVLTGSEKTFNTSVLPPATYLVRFWTDDQVYIRKLIRSR